MTNPNERVRLLKPDDDAYLQAAVAEQDALFQAGDYDAAAVQWGEARAELILRGYAADQIQMLAGYEKFIQTQ